MLDRDENVDDCDARRRCRYLDVYVQHQFEDVYWERKEDWSYAEAALRGTSYLKLPRVLQFFTGAARPLATA